jgi:hypothetical protein
LAIELIAVIYMTLGQIPSVVGARSFLKAFMYHSKNLLYMPEYTVMKQSIISNNCYELAVSRIAYMGKAKVYP